MQTLIVLSVDHLRCWKQPARWFNATPIAQCSPNRSWLVGYYQWGFVVGQPQCFSTSCARLVNSCRQQNDPRVQVHPDALPLLLPIYVAMRLDMDLGWELAHCYLE